MKKNNNYNFNNFLAFNNYYILYYKKIVQMIINYKYYII